MVHTSRQRFATVAVILAAAASAWTCQKQDEAIRTIRIYDLLQALPRATLKTPAPNYISVRASGSVGKEERRVLFMHPPSSAEFPPVQVSEGSVLVFAIGIQDEALDKGGDGVEFTVLIRGADNKETKVFSRYIDAKHNEQDRRWIGVRIPLRAFAGQTIRVILSTSPGPANDINADWAFWGEPMIVLAGQ